MRNKPFMKAQINHKEILFMYDSEFRSHKIGKLLIGINNNDPTWYEVNDEMHIDLNEHMNEDEHEPNMFYIMDFVIIPKQGGKL